MPEPAPVSTPKSQDVWPHLLLAVQDLPWLHEKVTERVKFGREKYGTVLQTHNGRDAAQDAREELYDFLFYWTQLYLEGQVPTAEQWLEGVDNVTTLLIALDGLTCPR